MSLHFQPTSFPSIPHPAVSLCHGRHNHRLPSPPAHGAGVPPVLSNSAEVSGHICCSAEHAPASALVLPGDSAASGLEEKCLTQLQKGQRLHATNILDVPSSHPRKTVFLGKPARCIQCDQPRATIGGTELSSDNEATEAACGLGSVSGKGGGTQVCICRVAAMCQFPFPPKLCIFLILTTTAAASHFHHG